MGGRVSVRSLFGNAAGHAAGGWIMNLREALAQITKRTAEYPQEAFEVIRAHKEEAKPYLREAIELAAEQGEDLDYEYQLYFYALFLLGEFQDRESFEHIMAFAALPSDTLDNLIGDMVTEGLNNILYNTYNGNLELLEQSVRNPEINDFARSAMLDVMGQLYLDGTLTYGEWSGYLKSLVYTDGMLGDTIYTSILGVICKCHLKELLPEIGYMFDEGLIDSFVYGEYDDCVDLMFQYYEGDRYFCKSPISIDSLKSWAMFRQESFPEPGVDYDKELKKFIQKQKAKNSPVKQKKIGRNDPCPCGSGKKYKRCCLNQPKDHIESVDMIETKEEQQKWLKEYPKTKPGEDGAGKEDGRIYLGDYYDGESIEIDKLLYLALKRRAVPIWENQPDSTAEEKRKQAYLWQAFTRFADKMKREGIGDTEGYDEKYAIHYKCREWMPVLLALLKKNGEDEKYAAVSEYYLSLTP